MQRFWEIAPPGTWALAILASICFLLAFVLLSHALVRKKAHGDEWRGWTAPGWLSWTVREGVALLAAGAALWSITLDAPWWVPVLLGLGVLAGLPLSRRSGDSAEVSGSGGATESRVSDSNR